MTLDQSKQPKAGSSKWGKTRDDKSMQLWNDMDNGKCEIYEDCFGIFVCEVNEMQQTSKQSTKWSKLMQVRINNN